MIKNSDYPHLFQRQDAIQQSRYSRHLYKRRWKKSQENRIQDFSHLSRIKLNKNKKYLLEQERNTQIDRSNRILYQKLARCAKRSQPSAMKNTKVSKQKRNRKIQTLPHSPITPHHKSRNKLKSELIRTLFMGHDFIDQVEFKIKLLIKDNIYYLVAENEYTKIVLQMPQEQYWALHYDELKQNPCNIFQYLEIEKGRIQFRTKKQNKLGHNRQTKREEILGEPMKRRKGRKKNTSLELPKIHQ